MRIYSEIGGETGVNGQAFADELNYIANNTDAEVINVRILSEGGSVMDGMRIFSAIVNLNNSGKVEVNTINDGICASIAGVILCAGKNRLAKPFAKTMVHAVSMGDPKDMDENDKAAMSQMTDMLNQVFNSIGTGSKLGPDPFAQMLTNKKDNWLNFDEAMNMGIITGEEPNGDTDGDIEDPYTDEVNAMLKTRNVKGAANKLKLILNSFDKQNTQKPDMKKIIMKLNARPTAKKQLAEASNEAEVETVVGEIIDENVKLNNDLTAEKAETTRLKGENETMLNEVAETVVEAAIAEGKFGKDAKPTILAQAKNDLKGFKALVANMNAPSKSIIGMLNKDRANDATGLEDKIKGKTFREVEKMGKNGSVVNLLKATNKTLYVKLYNEQYPTANLTEADVK